MAFDAPAEHTPDPVDRAVGRRLRARRRFLRISQGALADALGLTFQQIQKYESGANRISASKLYAAARFLNTPIADFFSDVPDPVTDPDAVINVPAAGAALTDSTAGVRLAIAAQRLRPDLLAQLANIADVMVTASEAAAA
ncbi:helix-turn-helix domain-containing protein [Caulobacter vibrioides]|uniref:helix-turn-helix domain-containing protein n=1 Tax=Caulobacter vibrioides TaxID=155892 RepID=UPI000BB48A4B|nr:helix-turn-helix transcriptional regulator [Caulobacter vibrioides]ATC25188.1 XRE family transcriptional regulator [Caulobacter vibrioides]PLR13959.1 XRE family transcriptional regulator [Caulobacter vibrioides]